jgi:hypothetical protein
MMEIGRKEANSADAGSLRTTDENLLVGFVKFSLREAERQVHV